jgi:hypothetical protein
MDARVKPGHDDGRVGLQHPVALLHLVRIEVHARAHLLELGARCGHAVFDSAGDRQADVGRIVQGRGVVVGANTIGVGRGAASRRRRTQQQNGPTQY